MSDPVSLPLKLGQAVQRVPFTLASTATGIAVPQDLTSLRIEAVLQKDAAVVRLTESAGIVVTNAALGKFAYDVSAANLVTLGSPAAGETINVFITLFNADNSLFGEKGHTVTVSL